MITDCITMPSYPSPIPAPIYDSDESSQHSNDSSNYLSSTFNQYTRLSYSPKFNLNTTNQILPISINFDDNEDNFININTTTPTKILNSKKSKKRKHTNNNIYEYQTPNQSPYTRRKNLDYVQQQQITIQTPKTQRRSHYKQNQSSTNNNNSSLTFSNLININPFKTKHHYYTRLVAKKQSLLIPSLKNLFIQRYEQEFHYELCLGYGEYSYVYLCKNRLDGLNYAIKISKNSLIGTCYEQQAWREICAYASLTTHENLIRYYSAWIENDGKFFLQLEYCNGGSLDELIEKNRLNNKYLNEDILQDILHQLSDVLTFMHNNDLAHLDIKPSNIMLCYNINNEILYKLTDLGHVNQISLCQIDNDGDCRYLPLEILQKSNINNLYLDKCDIYSLGLTLYVCGTNYIMPKQGNEWQQIRLNISNYLYTITQCSKQFNELIIERMCNIDPKRRPSAYELLLDPQVNPATPTSREYLRHSLKQERQKNLLLNRKLFNQFLLTNTSDLQILPTYNNDINNSDLQLQQNFHSPTQLTPNNNNNNSRILSINTPGCSTNINQSITSPISCSTLTMKQQVKLSGTNMGRCYSSII